MSDDDFKNKTLVGVLFASAVVIASKAISLVAQFVLAFYLSQESFGLYGMLLGAMGFVSAFQNPGIGRIHTQLQRHNSSLLKKSFILSLIFSAVGVILLLTIVTIFYSNSEYLQFMASIACFTIPLISLYSLMISKLEIARDYKSIARYQFISALSYNIILIILAVYGLDYLSFPIALLISTVITFIYIYLCYINTKMIRPIDASKLKDDVKYYKNIFWSFIAALLLSISLRGDYFILGLTLSAEEVGLYYFGFMLAANIGLVMSVALSSILMPAFSHLEDKSKRAEMYLSCCRKILAVAFIMCFFAIFILPVLIDRIWASKWNESIILCQLFLMTLPLKLLAPLSLSYMESLGRWRDKAFGLLVDGLSLIMFCYIGVLYGGLIGAALAAAAQRGTLGLITVYMSIRRVDWEKSKEQRRLVVDIVVIQLLILGCCFSEFDNILKNELNYSVIVVVVAIYAAYSLTFSRSLYTSIFNILIKIIKRRLA